MKKWTTLLELHMRLYLGRGRRTELDIWSAVRVCTGWYLALHVVWNA